MATSIQVVKRNVIRSKHVKNLFNLPPSIYDYFPNNFGILKFFY